MGVNVIKIMDFLKGGTMNLQFNPAQLSRPQRQSLIEVLGVMESENDQEIEVRVIEFPLKFAVKLDDDIEMLLGWDAEKKSYAGLTTPDPIPDPIPESQSQSFLICCLDMDGKVISSGLGPDIDPIELAKLKYELMSTHLNMPDEKKIIFAKEYARLWSEHK